MTEKHYYLEDKDIGAVKIIPKKGIKNFNIRLKPFEDVTISAPYKASEQQIMRVLERKKAWIIEKLRYNQKIEQTKTFYENGSVIKTFYNEFRLQKKDVERLHLAGSPPTYTIEIPQHYKTESVQFQDSIRQIINLALKNDAVQYIVPRTRELAANYGFNVNKISFRNNKTRWGSCSSHGNISFNIQLMRLSQPMIDYVIIHELCHTKHPNHGPGFKQLLYTIMPDAPAIEKELNNYRTQIF